MKSKEEIRKWKYHF